MGKLSVRIERAARQAERAQAWKRVRRIPTVVVVAELRADIRKQ